ncbi:MAG: aromatic amino acid hydroxylase, partial [Bdellovibrionaceae bacterium]|nr:aromatic amino acid hydroxylase [Pseudobdellovibrionaceae bacterium]
ISKQDMDQYEAIRVLSDIKEDPRSTGDEIARAEMRLEEINNSMTDVSEAALLSRMNWWTAEYGLIGDIKQPKIFGAGILSSVGEAKSCLSDKVKKIPLSVDCVNFAYDITEKQPQLFVAQDFSHLSEVLENLSVRLSYKRGGLYGLERARGAQTVNTVQLNSGLQISGILKNFILSNRPANEPIYLQFDGASQLAINYVEMPGQGVKRHPQGFSSPLGFLRNHHRCLSTYKPADLSNLALNKGERARLQFESGVLVEGVLKDWVYRDETLVLLTWTACQVTLDGKVLFDPAWGEYDMAVGSTVTSVFGGPADRTSFGETEDFANKRVPVRSITASEKERHTFYRDVRELREMGASTVQSPFHIKWHELSQRFLSDSGCPWLIGLELAELGYKMKLTDTVMASLIQRLERLAHQSESTGQCIHDGLRLTRQNP